MTLGPSGIPIPTTDPIGQRIFYDDFRGGAWDQTRWWHYAGASGDSERGGPHVWWQEGHAARTGQSATLSTKWTDSGSPLPPQPMLVNAGIGTAVSFLYGKVLVCSRRQFNIPNDHNIFLLFQGVSGGWLEIDFAEDSGDNESLSGTVHYMGRNALPQQHCSGIDATQWHVWGVEWTPGLVVFTCDGKEWGRNADSRVPNIPMWVGLQSEYEGPPNQYQSLTNTTEIDWVTIFQAKA